MLLLILVPRTSGVLVFVLMSLTLRRDQAFLLYAHSVGFPSDLRASLSPSRRISPGDLETTDCLSMS